MTYQGKNYQVPQSGASSLRPGALSSGSPPRWESQRIQAQLAAAAGGSAAPKSGLAVGSCGAQRPVGAASTAFNKTAVDGRLASGNALDRAQSRGITAQTIEDTLRHGARIQRRDGLIVYEGNQARVVTTPGGSIVGVYPRGGSGPGLGPDTARQTSAPRPK
jgi:hypothetical protein